MINFKVFKLNYKIILPFLMFFIVFLLYFSYYHSFAENKVGIKVPIIMYHSILKSQSGTFIVHPNNLENDLNTFSPKDILQLLCPI